MTGTLQRVVALALALAAVVAVATLGVGGAEAQRRRRGRNTEQRGPRIDVRVVEVAGDRAYLEPGETAGLTRGSTVRLRGRAHQVVATTRTHAVVVLEEGLALHAGDTGTGVAHLGGTEGPTRLDTPRPMSAFRGQWGRPVLPAASQHPRPVPIGTVGRHRRFTLALSESSGLLVPLGSRPRASTFYGQLRARVHAEPIEGTPLGIDGDVAAQLWVAEGMTGRPGDSSRPYLVVRELAARYGEGDSFQAAAGRLRYAASTVGTLDGVRVRTPAVSGLTFGAFGGFVPSLLTGAPSSTSRFGAEVGFSDLSASTRPIASLVAMGSLFEGGIDERRLSATFDVHPGHSRIGARAEAQIFDADNPWGASSFELTSASLDSSVEAGPLRLGARIDMRKPERSRWLASLLPPSWLCTATPTPPTDPPTPEPCGDQSDARYLLGGDARLATGKLELEAAANVIRIGGRSELDQIAGHGALRFVRIGEVARFELMGFVSSSALIDTLAIRAGAGITVLDDTLDLFAWYRPSLARYEGALTSFVEHRFGGEAWVSPMSTLDIGLDVEGASGPDSADLVVLTQATWRPEL